MTLFPNFGKSITQYIFEKRKLQRVVDLLVNTGSFVFAFSLHTKDDQPVYHTWSHWTISSTCITTLWRWSWCLKNLMRVARFGCAFLARELNGAVTHNREAIRKRSSLMSDSWRLVLLLSIGCVAAAIPVQSDAVHRLRWHSSTETVPSRLKPNRIIFITLILWVAKYTN